ncbi:cytochrome c oxidase assembly protein [Streptomyces sp. NPDC020489]|uniref:cytochrome c oxidase assembly protein n=1 Tax=Streptomyces sp. NPDC020489 TaxID=3365077 RepID=UPI0037A1BD73
MTLAHVHPDPVAGPGTAAPVTAAATLLVLAYAVVARRLRRRGDVWPFGRDVSFTVGGLAAVWAVSATPPGGPFTQHVLRHLVLGMAVPLLVVLARPLTLALRALPPGRPRRGLLVLAHSRPVGLLLCPPVAAVVDVGSLWLLYRTDLFAALTNRPPLHGVMQVHMVAAGLLFTAAVCQLDPVRRRWSLGVRAASLLAAGAAHGVLARTLYALPPPGTAFAPSDLHSGARWMYYGGDAMELALAVVLGLSWYGSRRAPRGRGGDTRRPSRKTATRATVP